MGQDAGAKLGWGILLGYTDEDSVFPGDFDDHEWNEKTRLRLFDFTEPRPEATWLEVEDPDERDTARKDFVRSVDDWKRRRDTICPVEIVNFSYEYSGKALMLTRHAWTYDYQGKAVDLSITAEPRVGEHQALLTAYKNIFGEYPPENTRPIQLLLLPEYG